jgi:hypothetical protein
LRLYSPQCIGWAIIPIDAQCWVGLTLRPPLIGTLPLLMLFATFDYFCFCWSHTALLPCCFMTMLRLFHSVINWVAALHVDEHHWWAWYVNVLRGPRGSKSEASVRDHKRVFFNTPFNWRPIF